MTIDSGKSGKAKPSVNAVLAQGSRFHGRCSGCDCGPAEGLGGGSVVQGSTADLVRLIDLSASAHQGHSALIPPVSSRVVQGCPATAGATTGTQETGKVNLILVIQRKWCQKGT